MAQYEGLARFNTHTYDDFKMYYANFDKEIAVSPEKASKRLSTTEGTIEKIIESDPEKSETSSFGTDLSQSEFEASFSKMKVSGKRKNLA
mmetsp:Transcript_3996/g.6011  ORF Transcript_3996/g.6011 Transcript_3996/m.6011 type:complete len:90 (+) Transcript_3996:42-311(+)